MISVTTPDPCPAMRPDSAWMSCGLSPSALAVVLGCGRGQSSARAAEADAMRRPVAMRAALERLMPDLRACPVTTPLTLEPSWLVRECGRTGSGAGTTAREAAGRCHTI